MATGGIFQLITNDGKQDKMLMATSFLKQRIDAARARRVASGAEDCTPTLYDIERTHILFTNAHFKPFAAIGFEYNKVTPSAGASTLGSSVTFSIPQFGDFFNDMVVHILLDQPTVDTVAGLDAENKNLFRWCDFPGERILKNVKFEVNGNPLDEYNTDAVNFHREFLVQPNKEVGWNRCMGQEETQHGVVDQPNWVNNGVSSANVNYRNLVQSKSGAQTPTGVKSSQLELFVPLLFWCNKDPRLSVPSVAIPYGQRFINIDLAEQSELVDVVGRGSNGLLADGTDKRYLDTTVSAGGALKFDKGQALAKIELYINNIFVNPEVHNIFIKRIGFTLIRVHRKQIHNVDQSTETSVLLQNLKWPIEALFVGVRPQKYAPTSAGANRRANLHNWHKFHEATSESREDKGWCAKKVTLSTGVLLSSVVPSATGPATFTVTATAVGQPVYATSSVTLQNELSPGQVLTFTSTAVGTSSGPLTVASLSADGLTVTFVDTATAAVVAYNTVELVVADATTSVSLTQLTMAPVTSQVCVCNPTVEWVTIKAHGIPIYNHFPAQFYNSYLPLTFGGANIRTPNDPGAMMINFCLYPGTYQPSGHINVSRAREFYIDFKCTSLITSSNPGNLVVIASAINFLLISDGSAVLRYST
jgi:hypothetical protein